MAENSNNSNSTFSIQGFNLVTLLKRLEAATSRLEDVTVYQEHFVKRKVAAATATDASATAIAPAIAPAPPAPPAPVAAAAPSVTVEEVSKAVKEFDAFITDKIVPYVEASKKIDSVLGEQAECFHNAILKERNVLHAASKSKKIALDDDKFQTLALVPINENIMKVIQLKDDNRSSKYFNYLNAVAEGVPVLGWIVTTTPVSYVPDFKDSAQFWTNRVLKDCKGKDDESEGNDWVKKFLGIFDELKNYVKEYQTTGLTFGGSEEFENAAASTASPATAPATAPAPVAGGAPPPPPPPPPPPADLFAEEKSGSSSSGEVGMGAVFAELNKGEGITSGLKKVDKSQMTHKNPELRKKAVPMPPKKPKNLSSASSVTSVIEEKKVPQKAKKAPQNELVDNKWMITHVTKADVPNGMITIEGSMDQSVYIGNCDGIVVQIKGKVNAISVNMSEKVGVVIEKAISSVELTKCKKCEVQVIDSVPIINVDQSESTNVYLSETALGVEIYSSCCTALNVNIPDADAGADGDLKEVAISEQLVTRFDKQGGHTTEPVVHG